MDGQNESIFSIRFLVNGGVEVPGLSPYETFQECRDLGRLFLETEDFNPGGKVYIRFECVSTTWTEQSRREQLANWMYQGMKGKSQ